MMALLSEVEDDANAMFAEEEEGALDSVLSVGHTNVYVSMATIDSPTLSSDCNGPVRTELCSIVAVSVTDADAAAFAYMTEPFSSATNNTDRRCGTELESELSDELPSNAVNNASNR